MSFTEKEQKYLMIKELELEYKALCNEMPEEVLWQGHLLRKIEQLKKEVSK